MGALLGEAAVQATKHLSIGSLAAMSFLLGTLPNDIGTERRNTIVLND